MLKDKLLQLSFHGTYLKWHLGWYRLMNIDRTQINEPYIFLLQKAQRGEWPA